MNDRKTNPFQTKNALAGSILATLPCMCAKCGQVQGQDLSWVQVAKDKKPFVLEPTGKPFTPWGFNYDQDTEGRPLEDYLDKEWDKVEAHFGQLKKLGASVECDVNRERNGKQ